MESEIVDTLTPTRTAKNVTQYLFTNYLYLQGKIIPRRQPRKHFSVAVASVDKIRRFLENPDRRLVCINDVKLSEERYSEMRDMLHASFERMFPQKSKFER